MDPTKYEAAAEGAEKYLNFKLVHLLVAIAEVGKITNFGPFKYSTKQGQSNTIWRTVTLNHIKFGVIFHNIN